MAFVTRLYGLTISHSANLLESIVSCICVKEDALMMSVFKEEMERPVGDNSKSDNCWLQPRPAEYVL